MVRRVGARWSGPPVDHAFLDQSHWYRLRAELGTGAMHSAVTPFAARDPGYVLDVSGAAAVAPSRHRAEATRFVTFVCAWSAQEIIAQGDRSSALARLQEVQRL